MEKRFLVFLLMATLLIAINSFVMKFRAPAPVAEQAEVKKPKADADKAKGAGKDIAKKEGANDGKAEPKPDDPAAVNGEKKNDEPIVKDDKPIVEQNIPLQSVSLGSADPTSPYQMLVTLTNRGAAIERIELNSPRYRELEVTAGYLGHLAEIEVKGGVEVGAVGPGTPAFVAGLKSGDVIVRIDEHKITNQPDLLAALKDTKPNDTIKIDVTRSGAAVTLTATLGREPLSLIRPEADGFALTEPLKPGNHDPLSLLLTLDQVGAEKQENGGPLAKLLEQGNWEVVKSDATSAEFKKVLPKQELEIIKRFTLAKKNPNGDAAYHLNFGFEIRNTSDAGTTVAYRLGGPTGLPTEGYWYANKIGRGWSAAGLRDILVRFQGQNPEQVTTAVIAGDKIPNWSNNGPPLEYVAVDAQFFAAALLPVKEITDGKFADIKPVRVGALPKDPGLKKITDVSVEIVSTAEDLSPGGVLKQEFQVFAGPKEPLVIEQYGTAPATLSDLVYYGWFDWVAKPMLSILHGFRYVVGNYGIAIIMLTVLVRGCMFPLSRKQALSSQKMQELQPEIKRIAEKYKKAPEQRAKAQQELFRKNNYNPMGGCLLMFIQLPIFVGLYRSLMVDVELRQAPLFGDAVRWASNLSAPDMFMNWSSLMPVFIVNGSGFFGLGPYMNVLPLITIGLFIWQQKMFMPPPADEQAAMQQKIMQYMMIFMGFMFFKVASGLCIYFIASSLWGITERKMLPKTKPTDPSQAPVSKPLPPASGNGNNGSGGGKKKQRDRR